MMNRLLRLSCAFALLVFPSMVIAQTINGGFETWESDSFSVSPVGWYGDPFGSGKSTSAQSGTYAASVWNWYSYAKGFIILGDKRETWISFERSGVPIANKPAQLRGYYTFDLGQTQRPSDSAMVFVLLKRYNSSRGEYDTVGYGQQLLPPAAGYTPFTVDITDLMPGTLPDSIAVAFVSSSGGFCTSEDGKCCYLTVDDVRLSTASGVEYGMNALVQPARVYPNPVSTTARIAWSGTAGDGVRVHVYTSSGALVRTLDAGSDGQVLIDRSGLAGGAYSFEVRDRGDRVVSMGRFVVL